MDCQLSKSHLPGNWVIETLVRSNQVDVSILLASSPKIAFHPSESSEDVLQHILLGALNTSASNLKPAGPEMWKWDVQPFIARKRSSMATHALQQLKDALLTGSHSFLASLKEQSVLPVENQPERRHQMDDDKYNGTPRCEGTDTNIHTSEGNDQLFSPALANSSYLVHSDLPNENFLPANRKRSATTENTGENSSKKQIISRNGRKIRIKFVSKYKNDVIHSKHELDGKIISSGVSEQFEDTSMVIAQYSEIERCSLENNTHVGGIRPNECISSKELVGPDEVSPREKQVPHFDIELPNDKSDKEHGQENKIEKVKCDKEGVCDPKSAEDVDKIEPSIQVNVPNGEGEETILASSNTQCTYSQDFSATDCRGLNMLADICSRIVQSSEVLECSLGKIIYLEDTGQNRLPGDGNNEFTSSKGLIRPEEVLHQEKEVVHCDTKMPNENLDEEQGQDHDAKNAGDKESFHELKTPNEYMNGFPQIFQRNVPILGEAEEDVDIPSDSDGFYDERSDIARKKNAFLSSRCTYSSQGSPATIDRREPNVCVKCNKGGKLLVCSTKSCLLVIHDSCLGSDASFSTGEEFYCPFCAYSRAISKYIETKKKVSLTRKDFATFVCLGTGKESTKQHSRSYRIKQHDFEQDDGLPKSDELNNEDNAKNVNNHQSMRKLQYEQGPGDSPSFEGSTSGTCHTSNKDKKETKNKGHISQCPKIRSKKRVLSSPESDLSRECKCSPHTESADAQEISEEENENSCASKYFTRVQKNKRQYSYPALPQLRRKRIPWTTAEEDKLKEGMRRFCSPHDKFIPWKKILEFGDAVFQESRSTIDLKDKWRNLCKASSKS